LFKAKDTADKAKEDLKKIIVQGQGLTSLTTSPQTLHRLRLVVIGCGCWLVPKPTNRSNLFQKM